MYGEDRPTLDGLSLHIDDSSGVISSLHNYDPSTINASYHLSRTMDDCSNEIYIDYKGESTSRLVVHIQSNTNY